MRPNQRSHSMARIHRRTPGHGHVIHFKRRRPDYAHCPITGQILHGVPRVRPGKMGKIISTHRAVSRYYGGKISHTALTQAILSKILAETTSAAKDD